MSMWKRLPLRDRANRNKENQVSQIQIGAPALLESTYDQDQLDRAHDLSPQETTAPYDYHDPTIRPSRARQDIENNLKLPSLHFGKQLPSKDPTMNHPSVAASSVYPQQHEQAISPPSSPYRRPVADDGEVSPIEEHPHDTIPPLKPSRGRESQIPVPRKAMPPSGPREQPQGVPRTKAWTQEVGKQPLMWDDYSGEPSFDGAGKPSSVKPGEFDYKTGLRQTKATANLQAPANIHEQQKTGFMDRASRFAQKNLAIDTRPPWKGASGRHAIVDAPQDKPGQPIPQPRREEIRVKSPGIIAPLSSGLPTKRGVASPSETRQVAASPTIQAYQDQSIRSIMPVQAEQEDQSSRLRIYESPATSKQYNPGGYPSPESPPDRSVTPTQDHPYSSSSAPYSGDNSGARKGSARAYADNNPPRRFGESPRSLKRGESAEPPNSRFSWTTTATSTYQHSPPPSPPPPMPIGYLNSSTPTPVGNRSPNSSPTALGASILDRGHPTRRLGDTSDSPLTGGRSFSMSSTIRKPVGAPAVQPPGAPDQPAVIRQTFPMADWRTTRNGKQRAASLAPSTFSTTSQTKLLPKTPQELASADIIATIQAQQSDLLQQRRNIQRLIADLEKPEAKNPLTNDFKMIREREKRLVSLKEELAEVKKTDHECGMRMHRAWKRKEREDPNTPGSIFWVRRATAGE